MLVPRGVRPGRYVLSFRWDCEHTPQVHSSFLMRAPIAMREGVNGSVNGVDHRNGKSNP